MSRNLYKKKGIGGVDPKDKRRLRRSIHQKEVRDHGFLTRRTVESGPDDLSPVKEPRPGHPGIAKKTGPKTSSVSVGGTTSNQVHGTKQADPRREMLMKWKVEKETKRKIDQMKQSKSKPNFKVFKVNHDNASFLESDKKSKQGATKRVPVKKAASINSTIPPVRRSSRLASKDTVPAPRTKQQQSSGAGIRGKSAGSKPVPLERKPITSKPSSVIPQKNVTKKAIPKFKEPVFPTMSSFTFRKEISMSLKNVPNTKNKVTVKFPSTSKAQTDRRVTRRAAATTNNKPTVSTRDDTRGKGTKTNTNLVPVASSLKASKKVERKPEGPSNKFGSTSRRTVRKAQPQSHEEKEEKPQERDEPCTNQNQGPVGEIETNSQTEETVSPLHKRPKLGEGMEAGEPKVSSEVTEEVPPTVEDGEPEDAHEEMKMVDDKLERKPVFADQPVVSKEDQDGADHYQRVMDEERKRLKELCSSWEEATKMDKVPEDIRGDIRSAIGKAQLLMNQRFHQFSGLIQQCRLGLGEKRTHTTDLQGFWDMVYFQIEDVNKMFANLSTLRENNWQQKDREVIPPVTKKVVKKKLVKQTDKRLGQKKAARERLAAIKAALKEKENKEEEKVIFDAGFFHVESPVKEKQVHCAAGSSAPSSPLKRRSFTPRLPHKRPSLVGKEQDLLRAVLQASHTPKMNEAVPTPANSTSTFTPEQETLSIQKDDMVTRLQDLGLSSGRKRRRSQRIKSKENAAELGEEEEVTGMEINDLSSYLMPSVPVVDLNSQAEEMMRTEPSDQLKDLGKRTHGEEDRRLSGFSVLPSTPIRLSPSKQASSVESATAGANSSVSPEMSCTPAELPRRAEDVEVSSHEGDDINQSLETSGVSQEDKEGALHYQGVMEEERERLTVTCNTWSEVIEQEDLTEEVSGDIRSAIGKAQLLMNQRFHQFSGLLEQCRLGLGEKRTHTTDLQGFWDMVYFQIEDVKQMFAKLSELKENDWVAKEVVQPKVIKPSKKQVIGKVKRSAADKKAARGRLEAAKAAMKAKQTRQTEKIVFDAGFFKVESPAKGRDTHCIAGTSLLSSPSIKKSLTPTNSPLSRMTLINSSRTTTTPRAAKEQDILRAVLQASHTPQMQRMSSPLNAGSIFTPEEKSSPAEEEKDMVTRLRDLGLNSVGSSNRKRRRSQRRKSRKEDSQTDDVEKENMNDLSSYLMPSVPVVDLNSQAEEMMRTEPADQLMDLGKRTPLSDRNNKPTDNDVFVKPPLIPYNPSPVGDLFDSPKHAPRRSVRLRSGRISAFSPPRRSFANVPPSMDLISFD